jgi:hypothetical protein
MDRCLVCGNPKSVEHTRAVHEVIGSDKGTHMSIRIEYCADRAECGEARAMELMDLFSGSFVAAMHAKGADVDR